MNSTFEIQNLKCYGCANTITTKLSTLKGIENVVVSNQANTISFNYENDKILARAKALLHTIGYPIVGDKNALITKAKSFISCAIGRVNN